MRENQKSHSSKKWSDNGSEVNAQEKALIQMRGNQLKNIDETINTPERYVSWFQTNMNNLDKYLEICPHCKKPTMYAFHRTVINSAVDYLEGKRMFKSYFPNQKNSFLSIPFLLAIGTGLYLLLEYIVNIVRG